MENFVLNLTVKKLTDDQFNVLSENEGLNFSLSTKELNSGDLRFDLDSRHRRLRLHSHFNDKDDLPMKKKASLMNYNSHDEVKHYKFPFNPPGPPALESMITLNEQDQIT